MDNFSNGVMVAAHAVAGLLFLRFWRRTHDRFFVYFAIAFLVLGLNRALHTAIPLYLGGRSGHLAEGRTLVYLVRLLAYLLILAAIVDKNRAGATPPPFSLRTAPAPGPP